MNRPSKTLLFSIRKFLAFQDLHLHHRGILVAIKPYLKFLIIITNYDLSV